MKHKGQNINHAMQSLQTMTESEQAKAFRESLGLTLKELGELTGYGSQSVHLFERGRNSKGEPHAPEAWRRYKMACLAVAILHYYKVKSVNQWNWQPHRAGNAAPRRAK